MESRAIAASIEYLLNCTPLPLSNEKILQLAMADAFTTAHYTFVREQKLVIGVIDFLVEGMVGVEVKIGGHRRAIWRQCSGYLKDERIHHLVVAAAEPLSFPPHESGKPITIVSLGRAWL